MKIIKPTALSTLSVVSLLFLSSAYGAASITTAKHLTANPAPTQAGGDKVENIPGELQAGKTESVILYVGMETGDYAGYCFTNDSDAGRAIMAACKDGEQCAVKGTVDHESACKVPGLEASLSDSGKITKVESAKSLGRKKK